MRHEALYACAIESNILVYDGSLSCCRSMKAARCSGERKNRNFTRCDQVVSFNHAFVIALSFFFFFLF
jgi:hypothetical protein